MDNFTIEVLARSISMLFYAVTIFILNPLLREKIEYLVVPRIVYRFNHLYGVILLFISMIILLLELLILCQRDFGCKTNDKLDNLDQEVVKTDKPMNPLQSKLLEYDKFTLPLWDIWLFFEVFCFVVCIISIISAGFKLKHTTNSMTDMENQKNWLCITEDTHLPNGEITSMIDYQYDDNGLLDRKIFYDGEGNIEKYHVYIYNSKKNLVETEVYKPVHKSEEKQDFCHDASDLNNKLYVYNEDGMCIFERSGANFERKYEYIYDKKERVSKKTCVCNNEFAYFQAYQYRLDGKIKKEMIYNSKPIILFNRWALFFKPVITRYFYDNMGTLVKTEKDDTTMIYFYDEYNNIIRKDVLVNGIKTCYVEYTYDLSETTLP